MGVASGARTREIRLDVVNSPVLPDPVALAAALTDTRWREVAVVAATGSTNADLVARAGEGDAAVDGAVLIAGEQTAGRGRYARVWQTPPGQLAVSAALRVEAEQTPAVGWLSLLTGLAVREAVVEVTGVAVDLKWPNDVLVPADGRKLSGILCEFVPSPSGGGVAVIGTGLNLDLTQAQPRLETAACLRELTGGAVDPTALAAAYLRALSGLLDRWPAELPALAERYRRASATLGKRVRLILPGDTEVIGTAVDVDDEGRIVVDGVDGEKGENGRVAASAGDVTHLRLT
ncbi:biotin--[acetyl-CoA-carboxylase] ligase [Gordonia alkaliphila]|uniref:biotin--[biotin carboxyl-carrier protein] ligase n=1 Tax=Gordonia alkaliphila TaxID=1053547 RepID=A0ABP8Z727_9ACTN